MEAAPAETSDSFLTSSFLSKTVWLATLGALSLTQGPSFQKG